VFKAHLENVEPDAPEVQALVTWVYELDASIGVSITSVYRSDSTTLIIHAPYYVWAQLKGRRDVTLIVEAHSQNLLPQILSRSMSHRPSRQPSAPPSLAKENVAPIKGQPSPSDPRGKGKGKERADRPPQ
jgi:hypothetical protein